MSQYSNLVITDEGLQTLKNQTSLDSFIFIDKIYAVQNPKLKTVTDEDLKKIKAKDYYVEETDQIKEKSVSFTISDNHPYTEGKDAKNAKRITVELSNEDTADYVEDDFRIDAIFLTSHNQEGELIIFSVAKAIQPEVIPAKKDDDITYTFTADLLFNVDRADKIKVTYSPEGLVKQKTFEEHEDYAENTYAKKNEVVKTVDRNKPDANGNVNIDTYTKSEIDRKEYKLKQYIPNKLRVGLSDDIHQNVGAPIKLSIGEFAKNEAWINGNALADILSASNLDNQLAKYSDLEKAGKVKTVNNQQPNSLGNINIDTGVKTINGKKPNASGDFDAFENLGYSTKENQIINSEVNDKKGFINPAFLQEMYIYVSPDDTTDFNHILGNGNYYITTPCQRAGCPKSIIDNKNRLVLMSVYNYESHALQKIIDFDTESEYTKYTEYIRLISKSPIAGTVSFNWCKIDYSELGDSLKELTESIKSLNDRVTILTQENNDLKKQLNKLK